LSLTVGDDGTATGGLVNTTISFMELRDQRIPRGTLADIVHDTDTPDVSHTDLHASHLCNDNAPFVIGALVPGCQWEYMAATDEDGRWCVWFLDPGSRSWARFNYQPDTRQWPVHQFGPRRLWDEVTAAYHRWQQAGRPSVEHWRFTTTSNGQCLELTGTTTQHEHAPAR
jgi:hypothetical protein